MIEPFLHYWTPQVFWLLLLWVVLYVYLRKFVMPQFIRLQKWREHALRRKQAHIAKTDEKIDELRANLEKEQHAVNQKARKLVEKERAQSSQRVRQLMQEEMQKLRDHNQADEDRFTQQLDRVKKTIQGQSKKDVAQEFVAGVLEEDV